MSTEEQRVITLAIAYRDARRDFDTACNSGSLEDIDTGNKRIAKTAHDLLAAARELP